MSFGKQRQSNKRSKHTCKSNNVDTKKSLRIENLEARQLLAGDVQFGEIEPAEIDFPDDIERGFVHGIKWEDLNADGRRDPNEPGLPGVVIYSDLNRNGQPNRGEPSAVTQRDDPNTDFDEGGHYWLAGLKPGRHIIREVVPSGYRQTFPPSPIVDVINDDQIVDRGRFHSVVVEAGGTVEDIHFGNHKVEAGSIRGTKWLDADGNSQRDPREKGVAGITIYLDTNFNDVFDAGEPATRTMADDPATDFDEAGTYEILEVKPGAYNVREVIPDGFIQTFPQLILIDLFPPIGPFPDGASHYVVVQSGQTVEGIDFGNQEAKPGSVQGVKWHDLNRDGSRDRQEPGLPGVTIYSDLNANGVLDRGEPSVVTGRDRPQTAADESGRYVLDGLRPGYHIIREVVPDGFVQTFPSPFNLATDGVEVGDITGYHLAFVSSGETVEGLDFGNFEFTAMAAVSGVKWLDRNGNGERDQNDGGLPGITIYSDLNFNRQLDRGEPQAETRKDDPLTDFDESGIYVLEGLRPGRYHLISEVSPESFERTFPPPSDRLAPWPANDPYYIFLTPGKSVSDIDFGNHRIEIEAGAVAGTKWLDSNSNGVRENNEPGLPGITIFSDLNLNGIFEVDEPHAVTERDNPLTDLDETGRYVFKLPAGKHLILEDLPNGLEQTFPDTSRRVIFPFNLGHTIGIEAGELTSGIDFGNRRIQPNGEIHGSNWLDRDRDGQRDENEPGLAGVTVYLDLNNNGQLDGREPHVTTSKDDPLTRANEAGQYSFTDLRDDTYTVREVVPEGFAQSFPQNVQLEETSTEKLPHGEALEFDLIRVAATSNPIGASGIELTYQVVWPNSCGKLLRDETSFSVDGSTIDVNIFGTQEGDACAEVLTRERQTINVGNLGAGGYGIEATLFETSDKFNAFQESFVSLAKVSVVRDGSHAVKIEEGSLVRNVNFGTHRVGLLGDFDSNGIVEADDIDLLGRATRANTENIFYDLNHDGMINFADRVRLVNGILGTHFGNANLDEFFDSTDLIDVFIAGEYRDKIKGNSTWEEGDWDGDGDFDTGDLVLAFQDGGYTHGARAIAAALDGLDDDDD